MHDKPRDTRVDEDVVVAQKRDQMLKLVTRGFFRELVKYGVGKDEIVRVASHLLDNVLDPDAPDAGERPAGEVALTVDAVTDDWRDRRQLAIGDVTLHPLDPGLVAQVSRWLQPPSVRDSFVPAFPDSEAGLRQHFAAPGRDYLAIHHQGVPVGIIGGETLDRASGTLEMRKLVGEVDQRGKGIGKRATFAFLYYAFVVLGVHKVYLHSRDINVRNLNLNSGFGFELEGVFLEDAIVDGRRVDVVRMALLKPLWLARFAGGR